MASWGSGISLRGPAGARGSVFTITNGQPTDSNATTQPGDFALDSTTNLLYTRTSSGWPTSTSAAVLLRGAMGLTGVSGASFYSGPNPPTSSTAGNDGDLYLALTTGEIFKHVSGSWADQGYSIQGPQGQPGQTGAAGTSVRGTQTYTGSGAPSSNLASFTPTAVAGDLYYDIATAGGPYLYVLGN